MRDQAQNRQRRDGLARPALADDRDCLAPLDAIRYPIDSAHDSRAGPELGMQILDLQERCQDTIPTFLCKLFFFIRFSTLVSAAERAVNDVAQPHRMVKATPLRRGFVAARCERTTWYL